ncbi:MAG TPA: hypothetical protein PLF22_04315 [Pseudomonadales bacterium]|nr:hypothetical protein [Pseudomonadales bacterium]
MKSTKTSHPVSKAASTLSLAMTLGISGYLFSALPASATSTDQIRMVRYINAQGVRVTSQDIPAEFAKKGYEIVNLNGKVLQTIPPELTPEEREKAEKEKKNKLNEAQQQEADKQMLLRYSNINEVKNAKLRRIGEISSKLKMLESNQSTLKQQLEIEQQKAAGFERSGRPVAPVVLQRIDTISQEIKSTDTQIAARKQEIDAETARFDQEIQRFSYLESLQKTGAAPAAEPAPATK